MNYLRRTAGMIAVAGFVVISCSTPLTLAAGFSGADADADAGASSSSSSSSSKSTTNTVAACSKSVLIPNECVNRLDFSRYLRALLNRGVPIILFLGMIMIVYAGIQYMLVAFSPENSKKAKGRIIGILTGALMFLLIGSIIKLISNNIQINDTSRQDSGIKNSDLNAAGTVGHPVAGSSSSTNSSSSSSSTEKGTLNKEILAAARKAADNKDMPWYCSSAVAHALHDIKIIKSCTLPGSYNDKNQAQKIYDLLIKDCGAIAATTIDHLDDKDDRAKYLNGDIAASLDKNKKVMALSIVSNTSKNPISVINNMTTKDYNAIEEKTSTSILLRFNTNKKQCTIK